MDINKLNDFIKEIIDPTTLTDNSCNGIQVEREGLVKKILLAVDATMDTITVAKEAGADVLLVHHGILWGRELSITSSKYNHYNRVKALIENNIGLIAYHLPLDAHDIYGNNAVMAKMLGLENISPFGKYEGACIGFKGILQKAKSIEDIAKLLGAKVEESKYLPFGKRDIKSIGIVSGGGINCLGDAVDEGLDLFIVGEGCHYAYHLANEAKINVLLAGHYFTETFGIKALGQHIQNQLGIECIFVDRPTGF